MPNEMILIRWYFEYNDWAKVAQITKKKKKSGSFVNKVVYFKAKGLSTLIPFLSIDKTFLYTRDQKYLLGLFRLFWLCNSD